MKDNMDLSEPTLPRNNLNTILLSITLMVLTGMGGAICWACMQLATLNGAMIGRPEFESKLAEVHTRQQAIELEVFQLKLDLADGKYRSAKPGTGSMSN